MMDIDQMKKSEKDHLNVVFIGHVDAGKSTVKKYRKILKFKTLTNFCDF